MGTCAWGADCWVRFICFKRIIRVEANEIFIDTSITYQNVLGFDGAFTDAAGINTAWLTQAAQDNLMKFPVARVGILSRSNVVADTESAIGSGSESHIGPGHFQLESPTLSISAMPILHMYFGRTPASSVDPGLIYQYWHNRNGQEHWRAVFIRDNFISSGITEMDKVWRLKLEMTRADVRFRYAANNGAKQHWTNIQHSNIKN
ncbi:hypothetical protein OUZ56_017515 [Daphnia magna]|uniref:Uncharacterized protein n=2 Tax=Daphnia magna TaxID=35525 RepID=A0ABR0ASY8_9CRUS|nr:hypothetical protein OUZ56_017515 [Daphnia magna]